MRFVLDYDRGNRINFWIAPDNSLTIPEVILSSNGRRIGVFSANHADAGIKDYGLHSTGQCRFILTDNEIPGLAELPDLEAREKDTNVLIFRRAPPEGLVPHRFALVGTSIRSETALERALHRYFAHSLFGLNRLSDEIVSSTFRATAGSQFLSGTILVPPYQQLIAIEGSLSAMLLCDPHVEMATRMVWLQSHAAMAGDPTQSWRVGALADAAIFAAEYDYTDPKQIRRFLRMMPESAYHLLYNPLTRQLATNRPDDRLFPALSLIAVDTLARFDLVGHRTYYDAFVESVFDRLGLPSDALPVAEPIPDAILALAEQLHRVREVDEMLVFDTAMSDAVATSVAKSWRG